MTPVQRHALAFDACDMQVAGAAGVDIEIVEVE